MESKQYFELQKLASLHIDGELDAAGVAKLESMLAGDAEAKTAYVRFLTTHSDLTLLSTFGISNSIAESNKHKDLSVALPELGSDVSASAGTGYSWLGIAATTAMLTVAVAILAMLILPKPIFTPISIGGEPVAGQDSGLESRPEIVARIIRKIDCDWEGDRWQIDSSSNIHAGQSVMMRRGLMEIEFTSGAIVTLEGPVAFTAESPMNGFLSQGKLTTLVPESAHGFTVDTPGTQTVDLGTEFGLFVGEDGITETHVFDGEVIVKPSFTDEDQQEVLLSDDMAIRTEGNQQQTVSTLCAVPARFAHSRFHNHDATPTPVVDRGLALWFSAEHLVQVDEKNRVRAWGDIESESNKKSEVAWQVDEVKRPLLVEDAIGKRPAIRFSNKSVLVTEPVPLSGEQTIGAVFRIDRTAMQAEGIPPKNGRQLINLNGPPHLSLRINDRFQLASQLFLGTKKTKQGKTSYLTVGRLKHEEVLQENAVFVLSVYNSTKNLSRLFINGIRVDQAKAPPMKATQSPRYLGSHMFLPRTNFLGDIAELFVYDTALTKKEISAVSQSMIERYGIDVKKTKTQAVDEEKLGHGTKASAKQKAVVSKKGKSED